MFVRVVQVRAVEDWLLLAGPCLVSVLGSSAGRPLTSVKGVLVVGAGVVGNLDARAPRARVLKEVDVGPLVEAVVRRPLGRRAVVVVDVAVSAVVSLGRAWRLSVSVS